MLLHSKSSLNTAGMFLELWQKEVLQNQLSLREVKLLAHCDNWILELSQQTILTLVSRGASRNG